MADMSPHVSTVFKELFGEIKSAKQRQWTITNYGLLILAAIYAVRHQLPAGVTHLQSKLNFLAILAIATAIVGSFFLVRIQSHMARSRCRLDKLHKTYFTPDELIPKLADPDSCCVRLPPAHPLQKPTVVQWDIGAVLKRGRCRG
jgi:uncharacterized integral membrane protein